MEPLFRLFILRLDKTLACLGHLCTDNKHLRVNRICRQVRPLLGSCIHTTKNFKEVPVFGSCEITLISSGKTSACVTRLEVRYARQGIGTFVSAIVHGMALRPSKFSFNA